MTLHNLMIRLAAQDEIDFVRQIDRHIPDEVIARKIEAQEILIAEANSALVGYLRLEFLWSLVPYIALIRVMPEYQRQGVGRALLAFLEDCLRRQGHTVLYSSSQADEAEPQAWHRHMGFAECGFVAGINAGGVGEIFFRKQL
jgi:GNAT superfamily N-acetyltransferase